MSGRRRFAAGAIALLGSGLPGAPFRPLAFSGEPAERRIAISARKFSFVPDQIHAQAGEVLRLVLTSVDFAHGFAIPDLGVRVDLIPGRPVELRLELREPGRAVFLCDNFCGDDHDWMTGTLVVQERGA